MRQAIKRRLQINISFSYSWPMLIGLALLFSVAYAFYLSPVHYLMDSEFSLLMDEALIHKGTPNLIDYQVPRGHGGAFINDGYSYQLEIIRGRLLYTYPWGSSLLSLPAVAMFNADGIKIAPHLTGYKYDYFRELKMQTIIATALCAVTVWVVYETAGHFLPLAWSLGIALASGFGTPIWSSASRSLWPQTWALLLTMIAIWILLSGSIKPLLLGTVLAWSCLVRPQLILQVVAITAYVLVRYERRFFWRYVAAGLCWTIPVCTMTWFFTGGFFSALYTSGMIDFPHEFLLRLYGVLLSPSRGLFIFSPVLLLPLYLTIQYWKVLPQRGLAILGLAIIGMHVALLISFVGWWGGGSYGPRLMLEAVPWFVLLAILSVSSFVNDFSLTASRRLTTTSVAVLVLVVSVAANAPGALVQNSITWRSYDLRNIQALWDWHDPQFLCWTRQLQP
jgi:hypothetical protein